MRCEQISTRLADHLAGTLSDRERGELEEHLQGCDTCRDDLAGLEKVWQQLGSVPVHEPDAQAMRTKFEAMLAEQSHMHERSGELTPASAAATALADSRAQTAAQLTEQHRARPASAGKTTGLRARRRRTVHPFLQACAAVLLVVAGIQVGRQLSAAPNTTTDVTALREEVRDLRQMVTLSLMQQQSASERLKGVSWSGQLDRPGNEVVSALIDTLMHDANVNVRLASIDALKRFAEREAVRSATIHALDTQTSPLVQMALIDFVVETQEREALESLRRLAGNPQINEVVRARATWGIDHLEAA